MGPSSRTRRTAWMLSVVAGLVLGTAGPAAAAFPQDPPNDPDYAPVFPKGTVLLVTSVHDNTTANKNNPDPRQWVTGGERTIDEMAHLNEQVIYITDADYKRIIEERKRRTSTQN